MPCCRGRTTTPPRPWPPDQPMPGPAAPDRRYVLTLSCPDGTGIVARITTFLADIGGWIVEAAYHSDPDSGRFFTRQVIRADSLGFDIAELRARFAVVARRTVRATSGRSPTHRSARTPSSLVSKEGHCLYDLLARWHSGDTRRGHRGRDRQPPRPGAGRDHVRPAVPAHTGAGRFGGQGRRVRRDPPGGRLAPAGRDRAGQVHAGRSRRSCASRGRAG